MIRICYFFRKAVHTGFRNIFLFHHISTLGTFFMLFAGFICRSFLIHNPVACCMLTFLRLSTANTLFPVFGCIRAPSVTILMSCLFLHHISANRTQNSVLFGSTALMVRGMLCTFRNISASACFPMLRSIVQPSACVIMDMGPKCIQGHIFRYGIRIKIPMLRTFLILIPTTEGQTADCRYLRLCHFATG